MGILSQVARVGHVWLTAIATLVAGIPMVDCRCTNGSVRSFFAGLSSKAAGCCCDESERSSPQSTAAFVAKSGPEGRSCCHGKGRQQAGTSAPGSHLKDTGCTKTLTDPVVFTDSHAKQSVAKDLTAHTAFSVQGWSVKGQPEQDPIYFACHQHCLPPPTDLVITLQHFLI